MKIGISKHYIIKYGLEDGAARMVRDGYEYLLREPHTRGRLKDMPKATRDILK